MNADPQQPKRASTEWTRYVRRFEREWRSGAAPCISDYLARLVSGPDSRLELLLELIPLDMECRWRAASQATPAPSGALPERPLLEDYVAAFPAAGPLTQLPVELIRWEYYVRRKWGDGPPRSEYLRRFSLAGRPLEAAFDSADRQLHSEALSSTKSHPQPPDCDTQPGPDQSPTLLSDSQLAGLKKVGRYGLARLIGSGGFADVFLALDEQLQRRVAVKISRPQSSRPARVAADISEARTAAGLDHHNILPVYDVGETEDGRVYVVSKYIDGCDLAKRATSERIAPHQAAEWIAIVAEAIQYAHTKGLIHRDLKPSNILLDQSGVPHVADFGLAIHEDDQRGRAGELAGTGPYMAPEQVRGDVHRMDGRVDIWALGVMLYELLTGRRPFQGANMNDVFDEILHRDPRPPRQIDGSLAPELERICLKALSKRPAERYTAATDLAHDLRKWLEELPAERAARREAGAAELDVSDAAANLLQGRYRIVAAAGRGTLGQYLQAVDVRFDDKVTIWIGEQPLSESGQRDGFLANARRAAKFRHPNVINHLNYDILDNGRPLLVLEHVDGAKLDSLSPPLALDEVAELTAQIGPALDGAHQSGLVHGSIKAANVMLSRTDSGGLQFILLHLGIPQLASCGAPLQSTISVPLHGISGTPVDLAPEQVLNQPITYLTDIYHFGALLYKLLTGSQPFEQHAGNALELLNAISHASPRRMSELRSGIPLGVEQVVLQCLAKEPQDRPASMNQVAESVLSAIRGDRNHEPAVVDEDVMFTVFRPKLAQPARWHSMLVFAHRSALPHDADPEEADPLEEVQRQAREVLGETFEDFHETGQDSSAPVPRQSDLTFAPHVPGVEFNPPRRSFLWAESVHREEFRWRASEQMAGQVARGRLSVYLGSLLIAEVQLAIRIESQTVAAKKPNFETASARRFRKIYASYAPEDSGVVGQLAQYAKSLGDDFLAATTELRCAASLDERLRQMIRESDVFQLFWSKSSMASRFVQSEWEYALSLDRAGFVRPVYWQQPLPEDASRRLPPPELRQLGFQVLQTVTPEFDTAVQGHAGQVPQNRDADEFHKALQQAMQQEIEPALVDPAAIEKLVSQCQLPLEVPEPAEAAGVRSPTEQKQMQTAQPDWREASAQPRARREPTWKSGKARRISRFAWLALILLLAAAATIVFWFC